LEGAGRFENATTWSLQNSSVIVLMTERMSKRDRLFRHILMTLQAGHVFSSINPMIKTVIKPMTNPPVPF